MSTSTGPTPPSPTRRIVRRVIGGVLLSGLLFIGLWVTVFNAMTAALVGAGLGGGIVVAGSTFDWLSGLVDFILEAVLSIFSAIGDFFTSFFDG